MSEDMKRYFALMESATSAMEESKEDEAKKCDCEEEDCGCESNLEESFVIEAEGDHKARIQEVIRRIEECGDAEKSFEMAVNVLEKVGGETYSSTASGAIEDLLPIIESNMDMLSKVEEYLGECGQDEVTEDLDSELDREIADSFVGDEEEYQPNYDIEPDVHDEPEDEEDTGLAFNYTATIQLHGYDYPLVLQGDDMDELKTVMRVLDQSGLAPSGEYKWNSRAIDLSADE